MSVLQHLTDYIANTTALLAPLTLPLASIAPLSDLIDHVTTTQVHPTYFPFLRFGAIHAARVSLVWAGMTKNRKTKVPVLQDLFGYLVLCCRFAVLAIDVADFRGRRDDCIAPAVTATVMACRSYAMADISYNLSPSHPDWNLKLYGLNNPDIDKSPGSLYRRCNSRNNNHRSP